MSTSQVRPPRTQAPDGHLPSIRNMRPFHNPGLCMAGGALLRSCTNILITTTPLDIGPVFQQQDVLACGFFFHLRAFLSCLQSLRPRFAQAGTARILA